MKRLLLTTGILALLSAPLAAMEPAPGAAGGPASPTIRVAEVKKSEPKLVLRGGAAAFRKQLSPAVIGFRATGGGNAELADWYGCCSDSGCVEVNALTVCGGGTHFVRCWEDAEGQQSVCGDK